MLTTDQILALSPDDSSAKAAKGLLAPAKWPILGYDDVAIWGHCQGSGSKPYQVIIDVSGPSFKCSCPSRKFPCKHGLALYILLAHKKEAFQTGAQPPWVQEWMASRQQRAEKQAEKKAAQAVTEVADPPNVEAIAKREAKRLERMLAGARDLERWMADLIRHGIADLPSKPATYWKESSARLVDAQAGGLAAAVRALEESVHSGNEWQQRTLVQMGRLQLLIDALQRMAHLPAPLRQDIRISAGWALDKEEVLAGPDQVSDSWRICGISHDENERLWERRVWLHGLKSERQALLLDFAHGGRRFEYVLVPGMVIRARLAFFPSARPLRALCVEAPVEEHGAPAGAALEGPTTWDSALDGVAESLAAQPWLQRLPLLLRAIPVMRDRRWYLRDAECREAPLKLSDADGWQLMALSGGHPLMVFSEWLGEQCRPLSAWRATDTRPCWTEITKSA